MIIEFLVKIGIIEWGLAKPCNRLQVGADKLGLNRREARIVSGGSIEAGAGAERPAAESASDQEHSMIVEEWSQAVYFEEVSTLRRVSSVRESS